VAFWKASKYQKAIISWARFGSGSACCNAVAGSGKSTTLKMVAQALEADGIKPRNIKIIVFGKANANQLISSFGPQWTKSISTLHSFDISFVLLSQGTRHTGDIAGWSLLRSHLSIRNPRGLLDSSKYKDISKNLGLIVRGQLAELEGALDKAGDFFKLVDLVRLTNLKPTEYSVMSICSPE